VSVAYVKVKSETHTKLC